MKILPLVLGLAAMLGPLHAAAVEVQPPRTPASTGMAAELLRPHLIDIGDGRRLNLHCVGHGAPTVLFEQGGEGLIFNWRKVQPAITAITRTCFYDRAGFGFSDPPAKPVTAMNVTDDLHALLKRAKIEGPIVLVGHSIGGFYATMYADRFPADVAGMVLVEPGFAGQWPKLSPEDARTREEETRRGGAHFLQCGALARQGLLSAEAPHGCFKIPPDLTPAERDYFLHVNTRPWWYEAEIDQSNNYFPYHADDSTSWKEERALSRSFGALPLEVLSAGVAPGNAWESEAVYTTSTQWWRAGHQALARRSTRGVWTLVPKASHFIQKDDPEIVVQAIRRVVEQARRPDAVEPASGK